MKALLAVLMVLAFGTAQAAPFLTCQPYALDANQPTEFIVYSCPLTVTAVPDDPTVACGAGKRVPATKMADGRGVLMYDLAGIGVGKKNYVAQAFEPIWGVSKASAPFMFTAGPTAAPGGLGLQPN